MFVGRTVIVRNQKYYSCVHTGQESDQCLAQPVSEKLPPTGRRSEMIQRPTTGQCSESERLWNTQSRVGGLHQIPPLRAQGTSQKRGQKESKSQNGKGHQEKKAV